MFQNPFSFKGRIKRTEYGFSLLIFAIAYLILYAITDPGGDGGAVLVLIFLIPMLWFIWAQGAKRSHDIGNSGWLQLIPFYVIWLLFQRGQPGPNQYGENTKYNLSLRGYNFLSRLFMLAGIFMLSQAVFSFLGMALCTRLYNLTYGEVVGLISKPQLTPEGVYTQRWVQSFYNIGSFLVTAVVFTGFYRKPIANILGLTTALKSRFIPLLFLIVIPAVFVISGLSEFNHQLPGIGNFANLNQLQETRNALLDVLLHSFHPVDVVLLIFTLAVIPAFCEEVFFRGLLLPFFGDWLKNRHAGVWISAVLFTVLHFSVTQFLPILFMGVVLGYIYVWTRSIWAPVLVHFLNNASTVLFHRLSEQYPDISLFKDDYQAPVAIFTIAAAAMALMLFWLHRKSLKETQNHTLWP
jgi:membrane protease YdiL (CAAX protease family)/uncharacterized membrane protein YhaH (DUF805 family)